MLDFDAVQKEIIQIKNERLQLEKELKSIDFIEKVYPSDANFLLIQVDDATKRYQQLLSNGIVIRNRSKEPLCENCLRITVGTASENKELIKILKEIN